MCVGVKSRRSISPSLPETQPQADWTISSLSNLNMISVFGTAVLGTVRSKGGPRMAMILGPGGQIIYAMDGPGESLLRGDRPRRDRTLNKSCHYMCA